MPRKHLTILAGAFACLLYSCGTQELKEKEAPIIPVVAAAPDVKDITTYMETIGTLQAYVFLEIQPKTSGTLQKIIISEGQTVKQGDPLFKIDPEIHEIKVQEAEAQLAMDQAGLKATQKKMSRYQTLAERDLVPKTEWDELKAQLKKSQAAVDLDTARLRHAQLELQHCTIYAPADGRVGKIDTSEGLLVTAQSNPLTTITQIDPLIVEFTISEKEFPQLPKKEIPIQIHALCTRAIDEEGIQGVVTFLDDHFDSKTGQLLLKGQVNNQNRELRPGQSVKVKIPVDVTFNAKLIPQKAIRYNQQGPYVFVVKEDSTVAIRQLILGKEHGTNQIVLEGIDPDEIIILEGHLRLSPGFKVEIKS
jgi:multidrug efflux system membrane fusion protein